MNREKKWELAIFLAQALYAPLEAGRKGGPQPLSEGQGDLLIGGEAVDLPEGEGNGGVVGRVL